MRSLPIAFLLLTATVLAQSPNKEQAAETAACTPATIEKNCQAMHDFYSAKFVSSVGFGYERMETVEEQINSHPWQIGQDNYVVKNIQLISLLKHNPPVVYPPVTVLNEFDHHRNPPVQIGKKEELRPLTEFEMTALKQLNAKKETMVVPNGTVVVGALRAETSCLKCHDVEEGAILGAFTYTLEKQDKAKTTKADPAAPDSATDAVVVPLVPETQAAATK